VAGNQTTGTLTVLAAASLQRTFTQLAHDFEAGHPGVSVRLSFGGSNSLATQITQGAPADVFAAANESTMQTVTKAGDAAGTPAIFATNTLVIATPAGNPRHLAGLADLATSGVKLDLCAPAVPCGAAAKKAFAAAGLVPHPVTEEVEVTAVVTKLELGEVDAGLVYRTDALAAGRKVTAVDFPQASSAVNRYPIVVLRGSRHASLAQAFLDQVRGASGTAVLHTAGFGSP
jgi:molybdate transport system substrate-binding protein